MPTIYNKNRLLFWAGLSYNLILLQVGTEKSLFLLYFDIFLIKATIYNKNKIFTIFVIYRQYLHNKIIFYGK